MNCVSTVFKTTNKRVVFLLGMGRTGSSLLSQIMGLAGCQFPGPILAAAPDNPNGFWEPLEVLDINERYLLAHDSCWHDLSLRPLDTPDPQPQDALKCAVSEFFERYGDLNLMVIKEPRMVMTAATWFSGAEAAGHGVCVVIPFRHPGAVIGSLVARDSITANHAARLWMKYSLFSEYKSRAYPSVFVEYDSILSNWNFEIERILCNLRLPIISNLNSTTPPINRELCHHVGLTDIIPKDELGCMSVYAELKKASNGLAYDRGKLDQARNEYRDWLKCGYAPN